MVIIDDDAYSSSSKYHQPGVIYHKRYPSTVPSIKNLENRGILLKSQDNLLLSPQIPQHGQFKTNSPFVHRKVHSRETSSVLGRQPSIISTISPTVTRKPSSVKKTRRYMISASELRKSFFYPVNCPKSKRLRRGKYRTPSELDAIMDYINIDSSMSKDLCLNQLVKAFEVNTKELYKVQPSLREKTKAITVDSNNSYIIYTPNPTLGKNSVISNAEQRLDEELIKLGTPIPFTKTTTPPDFKIKRSRSKRNNAFPLIDKPALLRTRSLPVSNKDERVQALWNLYLRRVVAERIKWRLAHSSQEGSPKISKRKSLCSSVDTNFFISTVLKRHSEIPQEYKTSSSEDSTSSPTGTDGDGNHLNKKASSTDSEIVDHRTTHSSAESPTRQAMFDSLEQLMLEVNSIVSKL